MKHEDDSDTNYLEYLEQSKINNSEREPGRFWDLWKDWDQSEYSEESWGKKIDK